MLLEVSTTKICHYSNFIYTAGQIISMDEGVRFRDILLKKRHIYWRNLAIALVIALSLAGLGYLFSEVRIELPQSQGTTTTTNRQSSNIEDYVQGDIEEIIQDNPSAYESYARDVVYHDTAIAEGDITICDLIQDQYLKDHCYKSVG